MKFSEEIKALATETKALCEQVYARRASDDTADAETALAVGKLLIVKLGSAGETWREAFFPDQPKILMLGGGQDPFPRDRRAKMLGAARAILDALTKDRLRTVEEAVQADLFDDLLEQAEHLHAKAYYLASAVVLRAVLEERLRLLCNRDKCVPTTTRPGIEDFNQSLYKFHGQHPHPAYTKGTMQRVTAMASIGNDAAHNKRPIEKQDTETLLRDTKEFLLRFAP